MQYQRYVKFFLGVIFVLSLAACTHDISTDYADYLVKHPVTTPYPKINKDVWYHIDRNILPSEIKISSLETGVAQTWVINFYQMLYTTMQSKPVQKAFSALNETYDPRATHGVVIVFRPLSYNFVRHAVSIQMHVTAIFHGTTIIDKDYQARGKRESRKMWLASSFGGRSAIQASTNDAIQQVLHRLFSDLQHKLK